MYALEVEQRYNLQGKLNVKKSDIDTTLCTIMSRLLVE